MKGMCYLVIGFALIVTYQQNPLGAILIGGGAVFFYILIKSRKRGSFRGRGISWGKNDRDVSSPMNDLVTLMLVQNYFTDSSAKNQVEKSFNSDDRSLEITKRELMALFDED